MSGACLVCGSPNLYRGFRCQTCYRYWLRYGQDRKAPRRVTSIEDRNQAHFMRGEEIRVLVRMSGGLGRVDPCDA